MIETLLDRRDPVAAMALLVQWLSQAEEIPLVEEDYSFHDLALLWMEDLWQRDLPLMQQLNCRPNRGRNAEATDQRPRIAGRCAKFLDYLEANAEEYWHVPRFEMAAESPADDPAARRR